MRELTAHDYDIVGLTGIIVNVGKIREMCRLVREHSPRSTIVVGGHVTAIPGWSNTPTTVTFTCTDNLAVASCSGPVVFDAEGAGQLVTGTAVDQVGRQAMVEVTVNVDLTPPVVTLTAPVEGLVTSSTSVVVTGAVSDALSGLAVVNCNGVATPVVDGLVSCTVPLRPGRNAVTLSARDVAGHSSSVGATVTLAGTATRVSLTPAARTMLVDEAGTLSLRDDFGVPAPGATWTSSDPAPGVPLMGDMYGGVVAGVEPAPNHCLGPFNEIQRCYTALVRFAGPTGTATWRYDSPGLVDRPAQGPDGTIYVVEHTGDYLYYPNNTGNAYFPYPGEKAMVILDGATGEVTARVPLEGNPNREPVTIGPIVGGDGFGYVLVTKGMRLTLHRLSRAGQVATEVIVDGTCTSNCTGPVPYQLLPDGLGGLLITATWHLSSTAPYDIQLLRPRGSLGKYVGRGRDGSSKY